MIHQNRYSAIIEHIFKSGFKSGLTELEFKREEMVSVAQHLKINLPKNLGDLVYSFRYRSDLPQSIQKEAPKGKAWIIRPARAGEISFCLGS